MKLKTMITFILFTALIVAFVSPVKALDFTFDPSGAPAPLPPTDSEQPDTIYYDIGGYYYLYGVTDYWGMVRFTSPSDFELRCIYLQQSNPSNNQDGVTVTIHADNGAGQPGAVISGPYNIPGPIFIGNAWLDVELRPFLQLSAAENFFVVYGPAPCGAQTGAGWYIYLDQNGNTEYRSSISQNNTGPWDNSIPGDLIVRAGGEVSAFTDLAVTDCFNVEQQFFLSPGSETTYQAEVENVGTDDVDNYQVKWTVNTAQGVEVFADSAVFGALPSGSSAFHNCPSSWTVGADGYYTATATVSNVDDILLENNSGDLEQGVGGLNIGWMTYDDGESDIGISTAPGNGWGNRFDPPEYPVKVDCVRISVAEEVTTSDIRIVNMTQQGNVELWTYGGPLIAGINTIAVGGDDVDVFEGGIGISYIYQTASIHKDSDPPWAGSNLQMPAVAYDITGTSWTPIADGDWMLSVYCSESNATPPAPIIRIEPDTVDFGEVMIGASGQGSMMVYNDGEAFLIVSDITPSAGLEDEIFLFQTSFGVFPADSHMVPFSWTPEEVGPMEGTLSLTNNATDPDPYLQSIRGLCISEGIVETPGAKPTTYSLGSNYPNPFNNTTKFAFSLPVNGHVSLQVYDIQGQEVANLADGWIGAGTYEVSFDASGLTTGVYVYRLTAGDFTASGKMVLMK